MGLLVGRVGNVGEDGSDAVYVVDGKQGNSGECSGMQTGYETGRVADSLLGGIGGIEGWEARRYKD